MAVTSRDLRAAAKRRPQVFRPAPVARTYITYPMASPVPYLLILLLCVVALALVTNSVMSWGQIKLDDLRYGRPRTTQLAGVIGHHDTVGVPTQFVGMNLNRRIVVFEIPGGDVSKTRTLTSPYLFGANEDLTPVGLRLTHVNADQNPDLVVSVKDEEIIYINENGDFRLINDDERAGYASSH